jgi:hypothetical protein
LIKGRPLFPGSDVLNQLMKIFQTLGTPTLEKWPTMNDIQQLKEVACISNYPIYPPMDLSTLLPMLNTDGGIDLLMKMLEYAPERYLIYY